MATDWQSDGITLPAALEQALESDTLVLFCGAGVSAAPPSCLPGFSGLVELIATELGESRLLPPEPDTPVQFDAVMGEMNELQHDVHARVSAHIRSTKQPNSYHRDLIRISRSYEATPRIVTTNFDLLFENGAQELDVSLPVHTAPALPLGNDFNGLVHLHGRIDPRNGQRMVVTDTDFGQAYITEGWATEFLTRMFERYVVLFVGYSADDTVMRYLARALPADGKTRFAFMEAEQANTMAVRWTRLGATPIAYPSPEGARHSSLRNFLENWRKRLTATPAERYDRIQELLSDGPHATAVPEHELRWLLEEAEHARHFWNDADAALWIPRLDPLGVLDALFDAFSLGSDQSNGWARWVVGSFASDHGAALLAAATRHRGQMGADLWFNVWLHLYEGYQPIEQHRKWLLLLAVDQPSRDNDRLSALLGKVTDKDAPAAEVLLHHMLTPRLEFRPKWGWLGAQDALDSDLFLRWRQSSVRDAWAKLLPNLGDPDHLLSVALDLIRGSEATEALFSGPDRRHALSARRHQVDGVEEYGRDDPYVLVVDIARDLLREFVRNDGTQRARQLLNSSSELTRRLAIDALAEAHSRESDAMLKLLIQRDLVFDLRCKPEVFRLLKRMYRHASLDVKSDLLMHIQQWEARGRKIGVRDYERYNVLVWLSVDEVEGDPVHAALSSAQARNPNYDPREHPNLDFWVSEDEHEASLPEAAGLFRGNSAGDVVTALTADPDLDDVYDNGSVLTELRDYLEHEQGQELSLLDEFLAKGLSSVAAWTAVLQSAVRPELEWQAGPLLRRLRKFEPNINDIAYGLMYTLTRDSNDRGKLIENADERLRLLLGLWRSVTTEEVEGPPTDPTQAHTTTRGGIAYSYVETTLFATRDRGNSVVDSELLDGFEELLTAQDAEPADPSAMMLARYAGHILDMAPEWSDDHLRPRLASIDGSARSRSFWAGVLTANYWSHSLMKGTRDALRIGWPEVSRSLPGSTEAFIDVHAAQFAFHTPTGEHTWVDPFIAAAPVTTRARWVRSVARHLDGRDPAFEDLLFAHWCHRLDGQPPLHGLEQRALLDWVMLPNIDLDRAVDLFSRGPAVAPAFEEMGFDYYDFDNFPPGNGTAFLKVALHLLKGRTVLPTFLDRVVEATTELSEQDAELAQEVWNCLLSLGYKPAREQLKSLGFEGDPAAPAVTGE